MNQPTLADFKTIRGTAGFFRVGQTFAGQWWLLDPAARPFFSCGVERVNRTGRAGTEVVPGPYATALAQRYGADEPVGWEDAVIERVAAWSINTLGAWTAPELVTRGMAYTEVVDFQRVCPEAIIKLGGARLPDVFDPKWVHAVGERAAEVALRHHGRRNLLGYYTDYALDWAQPEWRENSASGPVRPVRPSLLQLCLSLGPSFPAWHAAWEFVLAAHGDVAALAQAWEIELSNKEALRQLTEADIVIDSAGYAHDAARFAEEFARRYFVTCGTALRQADAEHLILGCRFARAPGSAVLSGCVYPSVDIVSVDWGAAASVGELDDFARELDGPLLLTDFSWAVNAARAGAPAVEPLGLTRIERMLAAGRVAWRNAVTHPAVVGYAWPRWVDQPDDEPPFGQGLVHIDDREAVEHTELLSTLNARAAELHRESRPVSTSP